MAACKFTPVQVPKFQPPKFNIKQADLPVTCKLNNPPNKVTIARARFFDAAGHVTTLDLSTDAKSFTIPNSVALGDGDLEVRIQVGSGGGSGVPTDVVEDCDAAQLILTITDSGSKLASVDVVVQ
jgi:hypothetical protein